MVARRNKLPLFSETRQLWIKLPVLTKYSHKHYLEVAVSTISILQMASQEVIYNGTTYQWIDWKFASSSCVFLHWKARQQICRSQLQVRTGKLSQDWGLHTTEQLQRAKHFCWRRFSKQSAAEEVEHLSATKGEAKVTVQANHLGITSWN